MKQFVGMIVAAGFLVSAVAPAAAQSKTITGETKTVVATVEAIEVASRTLTLKKPDGTYVSTRVPAEMKRFSESRSATRSPRATTRTWWSV